MNEENKAKLKEWADKLGRPITELEREFTENLTMFQKNVPGKTELWYEDAARHRLYLDIKADLTSPARPFDVAWLGYSTPMDVSAQEMEEKQLLWQNPETREQAVYEGKVYRCDPTKEQRMTMKDKDGNTIEVPDGTPLDTREWMIAPDPEKGVKGRKNRNFKKPLMPAIIRNYVGFGRPAVGGALKVISLTATGEDRVKLLPKKGMSVRTRLNVRSEDQLRYICNMSTTTRFDQPVVMPEIPDDKVLLQLMETCPLKITLAELPAWHKAHEKDARRVVILEGDVSFISDEPTRFGSYIIVLEDISKEDLEATGVTVFTPEEPDFGKGSRVYAIGRSTIGPGRNPDTGELDANIEKVNLNAVGIYAIPEFRVAPEEDLVVGAELAK